MNDEQKKLKEYIKLNFDFPALKKAGLFPKTMKHTDYEGIAAIICHVFDFKTIYEYSRLSTSDEVDHGSCITGKFSDSVDASGNVKRGGGYHLSMGAYDVEFECPCCTCMNTGTIYTSTSTGRKKCKGCKRKIFLSVKKNELTATEIEK